jgi:protein-tyrosine-phosphatase
MAERGVDIAHQTSKSIDRYEQARFDRVVTLCDKVREVCPELPGAPAATHWSIPDPAAVDGDARARAAAFDQVADDIEGRVALLLADLHTRQPEGARRG